MTVVVTDFTKLPKGTKTETGVTDACPYCGKLGLCETVSGKQFFTHLQARGINEHGDPEIRWVMCPEQGNP
jgi:hypothetical protein